MTEKNMTTSLVLKPAQATLLKQLAASRMMRGTMQTASVSEVIRQLIDDNEKAFRAEIASPGGNSSNDQT